MDSCEDAFKGDYVVVKEEYIGHVQERMGPGLRELKRKRKGEKLLNGKLIGGNGKLTDEVINKIQNYYGEATQNNSGDFKAIESG